MGDFDLVIIGTGSGNSILTPEFEDWNVAIVEKGVFGGTCLNRGCIPSKMLVLPADRLVEAHEATERLDLQIPDGRADWWRSATAPSAGSTRSPQAEPNTAGPRTT